MPPARSICPAIDLSARTIHDTLTGTLHYAEREVALGTMVYKYPQSGGDPIALRA